MSTKKEIKEFLSRFDPFKIQIGVYFRSQPMYHSKCSIVFSIILLGVCLYLPLIVSQTPYLSTIEYDKSKSQYIPFKPRFKILFQQQEWHVQLKCTTRRNNISFNQTIDLVKTIDHYYQMLQDNNIFCNLKQSEQQDSNLQLIIKCLNCSSSSEIQTKVSMENHYISSQNNNIIALNKDFTFKYSAERKLRYTIPVYSQIYKTYKNWFLGSFDMFPKQFYSFFMKDIKTKTIQNNLSQGFIIIRFIHAGQTLLTEKFYPSGLNYGLSVLAIYGILKFIFTISFLDRFQKRQLCLQRGSVKSQNMSSLKTYVTALLPNFIIFQLLKNYLTFEIKAIQRGQQLMNIDNLLKTSRKIAHDREPLMRAYININKDDQSEIDQQTYINNTIQNQTNQQTFKQLHQRLKSSKTTYLNIQTQNEESVSQLKQSYQKNKMIFQQDDIN